MHKDYDIRSEEGAVPRNVDVYINDFWDRLFDEFTEFTNAIL